MKTLIFIMGCLFLISCGGNESQSCETKINNVLYNIESDNCNIDVKTIDTYTYGAITEVYVNLGENLYEPCDVDYDGKEFTLCNKSTSMLNNVKYFVSETEYLSCELFSWYLYNESSIIEHHYVYVCKE